MRIQQLHNLLKGSPAFVVGTGPSLRVTDLSLLHNTGVYVIGLNQAYRHVRCHLCVTAHPELYQEYAKSKYADSIGRLERRVGRWVIKKKPPMADLSLDDERHFVFHTSEDWSLFTKPEDDTLFLGRGIQLTAMDLAARMGASHVILVGCDMTALAGEHHGHAQHVRFHGLPPPDVYREYYEWTRRGRTELRKRKPPVPVYSLTPFLGLGHTNDDWRFLKAELGVGDLPPPEDTSAYKRKGTDKP
jgi:hypothetical protein